MWFILAIVGVSAFIGFLCFGVVGAVIFGIAGFVGFCIWGAISEKQTQTDVTSILATTREKKAQELRDFAETLSKEMAISENLSVILKCPVKIYNAYVAALRKEQEAVYDDEIGEEEIRCYIDFKEDSLYIIPSDILKNECDYTNQHYVYNILDDYRELEPNYKGLFFKIPINDIKFYKQIGEVYADTRGSIDSDYSYGNLILFGDAEYRTSGKIDTTLRDNREVEFYYNDNGQIKKLIFDYEALTTLQLLIPDKEKK